MKSLGKVVLLLCGGVAWILTLAGVAAMEDIVDSSNMRFAWWTLWFQFFVLGFLTIMVLFDCVNPYQNAMLSFFTILALLNMIQTDDARAVLDNDRLQSDIVTDAGVAFTGFMLTTIVDLLIILNLSVAWEDTNLKIPSFSKKGEATKAAPAPAAPAPVIVEGRV